MTRSKVVPLALFFTIALTSSADIRGAAPRAGNDATQAAASLAGVWRVLSSENASSSINPAQPGLYIFTGTHYSITQVTSPAPRPPVQATPAARLEDVIAVYVRGFQAQAGSYTVTGSVITLEPIVAKNPTLMQPGFEQKYSWRITGGALYLTGPEGGAASYRLERVE